MRRLIILLLIIFPFVTMAQEEIIKTIQEDYYHVKQWVNATDSDSTRYKPYYHDILFRNVDNGSWRAVGIFKDTTHYYYSDLMEAAMAEENTEEDETWALKMVIKSTQESMMFTYSEMLFQEGNLIFMYERFNDYDGENSYEYRFYFNNMKLIRFMDGSEIKDYEDDPNDILERAKRTRENFLK